MKTLFATNKTFKIAGTTSDTMEPYVSTAGYNLVERSNAFGGGTHFAVVMVIISTGYNDEKISRNEQQLLKSEAKSEAEARAIVINNMSKEVEAA